jgi:hypothetical protein
MIFVAKVTLVPDTRVCRKGSIGHLRKKMEMESTRRYGENAIASPSHEGPRVPLPHGGCCSRAPLEEVGRKAEVMQPDAGAGPSLPFDSLSVSRPCSSAGS